MKLHTLKCPNCLADLEIEDEINIFYCKYCGGKIVLEGQSKASINAKVKIKEFEHRERIRDKELEHDEKLRNSEYEQERYKLKVSTQDKKREFVQKILVGVAPIILVILLLAIPSFLLNGGKNTHKELVAKLEAIETQIEEDIQNEDFTSALINANKLYCNDGWSDDEEKMWEEKRTAYIQLIMELKREHDANDPNYGLVPRESKSIVGMYYMDVVKELEAAGFINIETIELNEKAGLFQKRGSVEHINIGGKTEFSSEEYFKKDSKIIIYHYLDD